MKVTDLLDELQIQLDKLTKKLEVVPRAEEARVILANILDKHSYRNINVEDHQESWGAELILYLVMPDGTFLYIGKIYVMHYNDDAIEPLEFRTASLVRYKAHGLDLLDMLDDLDNILMIAELIVIEEREQDDL